MRYPPLAGLVLLAAASLLPGCVAALVPLAAGAVMGGSQIRGAPQAGSASKASPVETAGIPATLSGDAQGAALVLTELTALPAPGAGAAGAPVAGVELFTDYAIEQAARDPTLTPRSGALLARPGRLSPTRIDCQGKPPAVIIDLDPADDVFDPYSVQRPDPRLPDALARLRDRDVKIFWSSTLGTPFAGQLRALLAETGLDPDGKDTLLTMHSLDERKQTRRAAVAVTHCPVAILGDERGDFDELYYYLKDGVGEVPPDILVGAGWFLAEPFPTEDANAQ